MQRDLLGALLENDLILRDGMCLMESRKFKKKQEPVKPSTSDTSAGHRFENLAEESPDAANKTSNKPGYVRKKIGDVWKWVKDTASDVAGAFHGDEAKMGEVTKRVHDAGAGIGEGLRSGSLLSHGASAAAGGVAGAHLMKKHLIDKAWKYGPAAIGGTALAAYLAGKSSNDDR